MALSKGPGNIQRESIKSFRGNWVDWQILKCKIRIEGPSGLGWLGSWVLMGPEVGIGEKARGNTSKSKRLTDKKKPRRNETTEEREEDEKRREREEEHRRREEAEIG